MSRYVFGPVASRRLGRSLGVNNIPYKTCSYSCIYCQLGRTTELVVERRPFYSWREIVAEVARAIERLDRAVDYITFVPDGEPLLDSSLGLEISWLKKEVGMPIAVFTNSSLLYLEDARADLAEADLVSIKIDAVSEELWRYINRPHRALDLDSVLNGIEEFSKSFRGKLITETMLVDELNTGGVELEGIASFIARVNPYKAYIAVPVRPPAERFAKPPPSKKLVEAHQIFSKFLERNRFELLNMPEPPQLKAWEEPAEWIISTASVHPLRLEHALKALKELVEDPEELIARLVREGYIELVDHLGEKFLIRRYCQSTSRGYGQP